MRDPNPVARCKPLNTISHRLHFTSDIRTAGIGQRHRPGARMIPRAYGDFQGIHPDRRYSHQHLARPGFRFRRLLQLHRILQPETRYSYCFHRTLL